jgi:exodeoxyribonuclease VII large subunit
VWVSGEITNLRAQTSGHIYFTLKDASAQLACVLFRGEPVARRELLRDGQKVLLQGDLTVYEARGQYQLIVRAVELQGVGALQAAFERLKQKLSGEGLFAQERKRTLPRYPHRIGLVTSPTGAAIRDVMTVIARRHPRLELVLAPCRVQGQGAAEEIACAIRELNAYSTQAPPDQRLALILATRGGGSLEDLWAFNEEAVARAIFESALPVISAVGHEIDFTISDFVADYRAPTPSAAAEIITEGYVASREWVGDAPARLRLFVERHLRQEDEMLRGLAARLERSHPRRRLHEQYQRLDDLGVGLMRNVRLGVRQAHSVWQNLAQRFVRLRPGQHVQDRQKHLEQARKRLAELSRLRWLRLRQAMDNLGGRLRLLSPENTLARGYSITQDELTGRILRRAAEVKRGQRLVTRLAEGQVRSVAD